MDQQASSSSATSIASQAALELHRQLPPPRHGEYDALVPTTPQGLMLRILKGNGFAAFNGYLSLADGRSSPAELLKCIRGIGDKITAVEGAFVDGMSSEEVIGKIRRACATNKVVHLRLKEPSFKSASEKRCRKRHNRKVCPEREHSPGRGLKGCSQQCNPGVDDQNASRRARFEA
jgi:hypothetical protein